MSESEKKAKKQRRPDDVIAAEKREWLAKHEWKGVRKSLDALLEASALIDGAATAARPKAPSVDFQPASQALKAVREKLSALLPPEAR